MKYRLEDVERIAEEKGFRLRSQEYQNLDGEIELECLQENHIQVSTFRKLRGNYKCPICKSNPLTNTLVIPKSKDIHRVLGVDQSTKISGWAILDNKELTQQDLFEYDLGTSENRIQKVKEWLLSMIHLWQPDLVALEDIQFQNLDGNGRQTGSIGVTTFKLLAELLGVLKNALYENGTPYIVVPSTIWRQHCQVKGRSRADKKRSMQLIVKEKFDISVSNDAADAIGITMYASCQSISRNLSWE